MAGHGALTAHTLASAQLMGCPAAPPYQAPRGGAHVSHVSHVSRKGRTFRMHDRGAAGGHRERLELVEMLAGLHIHMDRPSVLGLLLPLSLVLHPRARLRRDRDVRTLGGMKIAAIIASLVTAARKRQGVKRAP